MSDSMRPGFHYSMPFKETFNVWHYETMLSLQHVIWNRIFQHFIVLLQHAIWGYVYQDYVLFLQLAFVIQLDLTIRFVIMSVGSVHVVVILLGSDVSIVLQDIIDIQTVNVCTNFSWYKKNVLILSSIQINEEVVFFS